MCEQYFDYGHLNASSSESETFLTDVCISNRVKLGFFAFWTIAYCLSIIWTISIIVDEVGKRGFTMNLRMKMFVFGLIGQLGQLGSYVLFLLGVQAGDKYLVFSIAPICTVFIYYYSLKAWFETVIGSNLAGDDKKVKLAWLVFKTNLFGISLIFISSCYIFGPIISSYTDKLELLNYFYIFRAALSHASGLNTCVMLLFIGKKFLRIIQESALVREGSSDGELGKLVSNLKFVIFLAKGLFPAQLLLMFTPFWLLGDLHYIFYYHFTWNEMELLLATTMMAIAFNKKASMFGLTSSSNGSSRRKSSMAKAEIQLSSSGNNSNNVVSRLNDGTVDNLIMELNMPKTVDETAVL